MQTNSEKELNEMKMKIEQISPEGIKINLQHHPTMGVIAKIHYGDDAISFGTYIGQILISSQDEILRNGFGIYSYCNKSKYIGEWKNNRKDGLGLLFLSNGEIFLGNWTNGKRDDIHIGINFWGANLNFTDAFVGTFGNGLLGRGLYYSKSKVAMPKEDPNNVDHYLYYGDLNDHGQKDDESGCLYDLDRQFLFIGIIKGNLIKNGYQMSYSIDKDCMESIVKFEMTQTGEDKRVTTIWAEKAIDPKDIAEMEERCECFHNAFVKKSIAVARFEAVYKEIQKYKDDTVPISVKQLKDYVSQLQDFTM